MESLKDIKNEKSHASMKALFESWGTGIVLTISSFFTIIRGFLTERNVNISMAVILFLFAAVWWLFRIKKERRDAINSETIGRTLLMEEREVLERIARNTEIAQIEPKDKSSEEVKPS